MKLKHILLIPAILLTSCAGFSWQSNEPYLRGEAALVTTTFLDSTKDATVRAKYIAIAQQVASAVQTVANGKAFSPADFHKAIAKIQLSGAATYLNALDGIYALAYPSFENQPSLANKDVALIAQGILDVAK